MRFFLISHTNDTAIGMRLAGIEGVVLKPEQEAVERALDTAIADPSVGVILITQALSSLVSERMYRLKQSGERPLIVEIPDRHSTGNVGDSISRYVREAVGIKL